LKRRPVELGHPDWREGPRDLPRRRGPNLRVIDQIASDGRGVFSVLVVAPT